MSSSRRSTRATSFCTKYLNDLSDADLRLRPVEGMHPIALQLGHLIIAEQMFNDMIKPGSAPAFPTGSRKRMT